MRRHWGRGQRALTLIVVVGTIVISLIGFVGSYDAVMRLARRHGFGWFSYVLPIGIDVGITVFLALDLLLTWMRIPLPLLRQLAWVLTGATIVFNAASAWPNPLSSGMHAVVPLLFVAAIEAARHTVGRMAQIEADQLFESTRLGRWVFAPVATFRLFRRRVLWELRSYEEALEHERRRLVYRARLRAVYGRMWRHRAPVDLVLLLKLANLGESLPRFTLDPATVLAATTAHPSAALPAPALDDVAKSLLSETPEEELVPPVARAVGAAPAVPDEDPTGDAEAVSGAPEPQADPMEAAEQPAQVPVAAAPAESADAPAAAPSPTVQEGTSQPSSQPFAQSSAGTPGPPLGKESSPSTAAASAASPPPAAPHRSPVPAQATAVDRYLPTFKQEWEAARDEAPSPSR